jgi:hypothetical protein
MTRVLLFLSPIVLASCGGLVTQREIIEHTQAEIASRESWSDTAVILVDQKPNDWQYTWRVSAGAFDYTDYPNYRGIRMIPGTRRELCFSRDGCLMGYFDATGRCEVVSDAVWSAPSEK